MLGPAARGVPVAARHHRDDPLDVDDRLTVHVTARTLLLWPVHCAYDGADGPPESRYTSSGGVAWARSSWNGFLSADQRQQIQAQWAAAGPIHGNTLRPCRSGVPAAGPA